MSMIGKLGIRKLGALGVAAVLAVTLLPATSAVASAQHGGYAGCYGVRKKGNYNNVRLAVTGVFRGKTVAGFARQSVTFKCQRVNSIPVVKMWVDHVTLVIGRHGRRVEAGTRETVSKAQVQQKTHYVAVPCGTNMRVYAKFHYEFYDHTRVRPFSIHGPLFSRC